MTMRVRENKPNAIQKCKCCLHPGRAEIDAMLLNGATYNAIIARMKAAHPEAPVLSAPNLSRHKTGHLLTQPIKVTTEEGEGYIVGHLTKDIRVKREAIPAPEDRVSVPEALAVIINAGVRNIMQNPELVTPQVLTAALEMARKIGLGSQETDEFNKAWAALGKAKEQSKKRVKRTRTVTAQETVEEEEVVAPEPEPAQGVVVEGETVKIPDEWSPEELKLLGAGEGESSGA